MNIPNPIRLFKDNRAQGGIVGFFIGAMLAVLIALQVAWPVMDTAIYGGEAKAVGVLTFTGNVSNGELINITNGGAVYNLEFNTTGIEETSPWTCVTANCILVNVSIPWNTSVLTSGNLTAAINANASLAALVTAVNTTNTTTITAVNSGDTYNAIATTENAENAAWGSATLTGGADKNTDNMSDSAETIVDQLPLFLVLVLLMVFIKAAI